MTSNEKRKEARYQRRKAKRLQKKLNKNKSFDDFNNIIDPEHLLQSYYSCRKGVAWKHSVQKYESKLIKNISESIKKLKNGEPIIKDEEVFVREKFNMRPLEYMETLGWIGEDVWYAHGIHFNEKELKYLADTKTGVAHCPISNMKLSSGVCRIPEMLELNVPVGLAVDGSASNDGSSLLEEMRVCYLLHRLNSSDKAPSAYDILKIATNGSARVLGRDDIGSLEVGKAADLFMIDMRRLEMVGANFDPKSLFGTIGWKGSVDYTIVNGKVVVEKGILQTVDEEKMYKLADETENKYLKK